MKKLSAFILVAFSVAAMAQDNQVLNSINYLKSKELDKAKIATDLAVANESTKGKAKTWMYNGKVYLAIHQDTGIYNKLDNEAAEKALQAFITCLKLDAGKDIYKDDVKGLIVQAAAATNGKARLYAGNKEFEKAIKCYDLVETALPYDFDQAMKRNNMTREKLLFSRFELYKYAANAAKTEEFANKLIEIKYKDPKIYTDMVQLSLINKDTVKALSYLEKGKLLFEENMDLINMELNIYLAQNRTDILRDKLKAAIELAPDNEVLHLVLANLYKGTNKIEDAEKEYMKALEIKPDYEPANYNLGVLYYSQGKEWNDKLNALPLKDPKTKDYETKTNDSFKKSVGYFEKSYEVTKDKRTKQLLRQLYLRLGDTAKADLYK